MAISETDSVVTYKEHISLAARIFIAVIGFGLAVVGPAGMVSLAMKTPPLSLSFALSVITALALFAFGALCLIIAFGSVATLTFEKRRRVLVVVLRGPVVRRRTEYDFAAVSGPAFKIRQSEDGDFAVLRLGVAGRKHPIEMSNFDTIEEARAWQGRLAQILGGTSS